MTTTRSIGFVLVIILGLASRGRCDLVQCDWRRGRSSCLLAGRGFVPLLTTITGPLETPPTRTLAVSFC